MSSRFTVTVDIPFTEPFAAVIVADPSAKAENIPDAVIVPTVVLLLVQLMMMDACIRTGLL